MKWKKKEIRISKNKFCILENKNLSTKNHENYLYLKGDNVKITDSSILVTIECYHLVTILKLI